MKKIVVLFTVLLCTSNCLFSQSLDTKFGGKGYVTTNFGKEKSYGESGAQVIPQIDGTCMVVVQISYSYATVSHYLNNGNLDSSFGNKGYGQLVDLLGAKAVQQSDGKIVVAGTRNFGGDYDYNYVIVRYNINGSLDSSFGINGTIKGSFNAFATFLTAIALDNKGNIVVAGYINLGNEDEATYDFAVARYTSDGSLDSNFNNNGKLTKDFYGFDDVITSMAVETDGKIILVTHVATDPNYEGRVEEFTLMRLNVDGTFDNTFGKNGKSIVDTGFRDIVALQTDGKIVVCYDKGYNANQLGIARFNSNGSPDVDFGVGGRVATQFTHKLQFTSIALQNNGKIVLSLWEESYPPEDSKDFLIVRYNSNGMPDAGFGGNGVLKTDFGYNEAANAVAIQSDGKIVAVGSSSAHKLAFARYNSNGSLDHTFSDDGKELTDYTAPSSSSLYCIATQTDGKVLVGGFIEMVSTTSFVLARYTRDGSLDGSFGEGGKVGINFQDHASAASIGLQSNGKIVVAVGTHIVVYSTDGSLDKTFDNKGILNTVFYNISSIGIQKDDKIVVAGMTLNYTDSIIRYNIDGSLDKSFLADKTFFAGSDNISHIAIQADGKIVGAGSVHIVGAGSVLVRFNTDGTIDNTFGKNGKQKLTNIDFNSLAVDVAGKIIVGGYIGTAYDYATLARFNKDGSIDNTFTAADFSKLSFFMTSLVSTSDGKIIVTGEQSSNRGNITVIELKNNGSLDSGFNGNGVLVTDLGYYEHADALALYNNKLYVAGTLNSENIYTSGLLVAYDLTDVNKAPVVSLSIPDSIVKYAAPARIKLNATANDEVGKITKVQFYNGTTRLHTETEFPYGFLWVDVPEGNYTLTAKAFDSAGNVITSNSINVSVIDSNVAPVVSIVSPVNNTTYTGPATIRLIANAKDPNDKISKVEFCNGTTLIRTEHIYPYTYTWTNLQPGTYTITAKATDDKGLSATSEPVQIIVKAPNEPMISSRLSSVNDQSDLKNTVGLKLSPNPAGKTLQVYTNGFHQNKPLTLSVVSAAGAVQKTMQSNSSNKVVQMDVSSLASGVYTVRVICGDKVMYKQFVKL